MPNELRDEVKKLANPAKAKILTLFFKIGPGEYGEGDKFLGLTVPQCRQLVRKYKDLSFQDITELLHSGYHEERLIALLLLVHNFSKDSQKIYDLYLKST